MVAARLLQARPDGRPLAVGALGALLPSLTWLSSHFYCLNIASYSAKASTIIVLLVALLAGIGIELFTHKEKMDLETAQTNTTAKLPILKQGPVSTEEKAQKNNDVNARSMLLMALPNDHLMTFNQYKDAKTLFAVIQTRFGGNKATKKTRKTLLKQITNEVNTAYGVSTANTQVSPASTQVCTASTQVSTANLKEMDLKWQLALLSMRTKRFFQKTGRKITINGSDTTGYDKSRRTVNVEDTSSKAMVAIDRAGFDWSYMADDEVPTNMALMGFLDSENRA
ncbi:hypothetical protein Tco_1072154 [Tanacetum coccineum]